MFNTIKQYIGTVKESDVTFDEYYRSYIMRVQDINLEKELKHLSARNVLSLHTMDQLIANTLKEVITFDSSNLITELVQ